MSTRFTLAAASAAACLLGSGASSVALAQSRAGAVPWLDAPVAAAPVPAAAGTRADHACAASELAVTAGQQGAWHGFATQELHVSKTGAGACTLPDALSIALVADDGSRRAVQAAPAAAGVAGRVIELAPGTDALLLVGAPGSCDAAAGERREVARRLELAPSGGGTIAVDGVHVDTLCGAASIVYAESVVDEQREAAATAPAALAARLEAPAAVARGQVLHYVVTLTNHGNTALSLASCPSYAQSLHVEGRSVQSSYRLNCAAAGNRIAAHASVSFEMQAAVPADLAGASVKLSWALQDGPGAGTIAALR